MRHLAKLTTHKNNHVYSNLKGGNVTLLLTSTWINDFKSLYFVGITGLLGIVAWRVLRWKKVPKKQLHDYIIHTRLYAQGFLVLSICSVIAYQLVDKVYIHPIDQFKKDKSQK